MKVIQFPDRKAWLEGRRKGIGGSDVPAILGLSTFRTRYQVWMDKVGLSALDEKEGADAKEPLRLRLGTRLEPVIAETLEEEAGVKVQRFSFVIAQHDDLPFLQCSPDGTVTTADGEVGLFEAKAADSSKAEEWEEGIPEDYLLQVQYNLGVTGYAFAIIACLIGGTRDFRWMRVERDERTIAEVLGHAQDFWKMVLAEVAPDPTGSDNDAKALAERYPRPAPGKSIALGADELDLTWELQRLKEEQERLEERDTEIRNIIRAKMEDAEEAILPDGTKWTWKLQRRKEYTVAATEFRVLRMPSKKKGE